MVCKFWTAPTLILLLFVGDLLIAEFLNEVFTWSS